MAWEEMALELEQCPEGPLQGQALTLWLLDWKALGTHGGHSGGLGLAAVY